ncbi:hypothetical protein SETIT_8G115100v2 [Setaria italica]|uniref:Dehydrin n=1 Tax=Setaria italica TaxID=4555 RepID=A0A368S8B8_SETIT|nr:hypothetical protein SETIT_8G115100v2 [Setaria italica]
MGTHGTSNGTHGAIRVTGVHDTGILGGGGHTGVTTGTHSTATGAALPHAAEHKTGGILRRSSSSSSSSSSEDDGMGGCRMKGLKEKIKEKMPGGHKGNQGKATAPGAYSGMTGYTGPTSTGTTGGQEGRDGKIKEKLPSSHKDHDQQHTMATGGYAPGRTGTTDTYGTTTTKGTHEKKRFMEKVKEKLPGQH